MWLSIDGWFWKFVIIDFIIKIDRRSGIFIHYEIASQLWYQCRIFLCETGVLIKSGFIGLRLHLFNGAETRYKVWALY